MIARPVFLLLAWLLPGCSAAAPPPADPAFDRTWHDGRAEIDAYRLEVDRYGGRRAGQAVLVYVTEPWSERLRVKVEDPKKHEDVVDVLKLNLVRDFQTGIYDYNTMLSTFVRTSDLSPLQISFVSTEWCGNVHEELRLERRRMTFRLTSYFEGEDEDRALERPAGSVLEDELPILLRGLKGAWLRPGESRRVPYLEGAFWRRLAHRPLAWTTATIGRRERPERVSVPAGTFDVEVYDVRTREGREGRFDVEAAPPRRVVRWSWSAGQGRRLGGADRAELRASRRLRYWERNRPGDEALLDSLGLAPGVSAR